MNKRGQGIQFNWIFVIVAGAIILGFFTLFIFKYIDLQVAKENVQIARALSDTMLVLEGAVSSGSLVIPYYDSSAELSGLPIMVEYSCKNEDASFVVNQEELSRQRLLDEVVFSSSKMVVTSMNTWIYPWHHPYFITNFIYVSDPKIKYYLLYENSEEEYVRDLAIVKDFIITDAFNIELITSSSQIKGENVKVVWFGDSSIKPSMQVVNDLGKNKNLEFIHVDKDLHQITFYDAEQKVTSYVGDALLFGAIFSDSFENYECGKKRALKRFNSVTRIINGRIDLLSRFTTDGNCMAGYASIQMLLSEFANNPYLNLEEVSKANENLVGEGCMFAF